MPPSNVAVIALLLLALVSHGAWTNHVMAVDSPETFSETLTVRRLTSDLIDARFRFRAVSGSRTEFFPRSIAQLVSDSSGVKSFGLTLTRGVWQSEQWGMPPNENSSFPYWGAPGVVLEATLASIDDKPSAGGDAVWTRFVRSLAGMTCVSFEQVASESSVALLSSDANEKRLLALLPSETACTENLSKCMKLLPCRTQAGLGKLVRATSILRGAFYSMSIFVRKTTSENVELEVFVRAVFPRAPSLAQSLLGAEQELTQAWISHCPTSPLRVFSINGTDVNEHVGSPESIQALDLQSLVPPPSPKTFEVVKWVSSVQGGDIWGSLSVSLRNQHPSKSIRVGRILDIVPSYLHVRFDSIRAVDARGAPRAIRWSVSRNQPSSPIALTFAPVTLPPNSLLTISYDFDKVFLAYDDYPPNPNRGFDVPAALVELVEDDASEETRAASNAALVSLPLPDFSMPYNVVTLTCTAFALILGSFVNVVARIRGKDFTDA